MGLNTGETSCFARTIIRAVIRAGVGACVGGGQRNRVWNEFVVVRRLSVVLCGCDSACCVLFFFFLVMRLPPGFTLFPSPPLCGCGGGGVGGRGRGGGEGEERGRVGGGLGEKGSLALNVST